ncbi:FAD-dependent oxidoreductase, partial [Streptomyces sp. WELS2]
MIVVGGGVAGLTTAVLLAESGRRVRVWAREPAERTTSAVAGGLWWPYRIEPEPLVGAWALESLRVYQELAARPE